MTTVDHIMEDNGYTRYNTCITCTIQSILHAVPIFYPYIVSYLQKMFHNQVSCTQMYDV